MATSDDRLAVSSINNSSLGNPLGLVLNQLIIMTMVLKQIAGISDDDFTLMQAPAPNYQSGVTLLSTIIN